MNRLKDFFSNTTRALSAIVAALVIVVLAGFGISFARESMAQSNAIGQDNAQQFAFAHAEIDPAEATITKTEFEREDGRFVYEIDFMHNNQKYEYTIDANDGRVIKREVEGTTASGQAPATLDDATVTIEQAKETVWKDAGVDAAAVTITEEKTNKDDGRLLHEIDFYTDEHEYNYEVDAMTGEIHKKEVEERKLPPSQSGNATELPAGGVASSERPGMTNPVERPVAGSSGVTEQATSDEYIDVEKAKAIALEHAGIAAADAQFSKAKLDRDDGIMEYEIEFYVGHVEYEYEIDATTGAILDFDIDHD